MLVLSGFIYESSFFIKGMGVLVDQKLSIFQITLLSLYWSICNWRPNSTESTWQKLLISPNLQSPKLVVIFFSCVGEGLHWQTFEFTSTIRILFLPEYKIVDDLTWINKMVWILWIDQNWMLHSNMALYNLTLISCYRQTGFPWVVVCSEHLPVHCYQPNCNDRNFPSIISAFKLGASHCIGMAD